MNTASTGIDRGVELRRLARMLNRDTTELDYLAALDGEGLQLLRRKIQDGFLKRHEDLFRKLAAMGKLMPAKLNAMFCIKFFGPTMTANMAYYTDAKLAASMATQFDATFLTDVAVEMIPERAEPMMREQSVELMRPVTRQLAERGEYHVMGAFVDFMPEDKILALMDEVQSPEANLRISTFAQRKDRIADLVGRFDDDMLSHLIRTAFEHDELVDEILTVAADMDGSQQQRCGEITRGLGHGLFARGQQRADELGLTERLTAMLDS